MRFIATTTIVGTLVSVAAASAAVDLLLPEVFHLAKRQPSDPSYQCHANCGFAIQNAKAAKDEGYCKDPKWNKLLEDCLDCALKYDIWNDYGKGVSAAAKKCNLDATPKPADGDSSPTTPIVPPVVTESEPAAKEPTAAATKADPSTPTIDSSKQLKPSSAEGKTAASAATAATATTAARNGLASVKSSPGAAAASAAASSHSNSTGVRTSPAGPDSTATAGEPVRTSGASSNMLPGLVAAGIIVLIAGGLSLP